MKAVYKRELASYFHGFSGFLFAALLLLVVGLYMLSVNFTQGYPQFEYALGSVSFLYLIIVPILTMRSVAEERKQKTDQLLYSLPLTTWKIVFGKYFAMLTVLALPILLMLTYPLILSLYGSIAFAPTYGAILGYFLLGASLIAVGMFLSSLTENVVVSAVLSFGAVLLFYLMGGLSTLIPSDAKTSAIAFVLLGAVIALIIWLMTKNYLASVIFFGIIAAVVLVLFFSASSVLEGSFTYVMNALSVFERFDNFIYGIMDLTSIVYYLTVIGFSCFLTQQSLEKRRWS